MREVRRERNGACMVQTPRYEGPLALKSYDMGISVFDHCTTNGSKDAMVDLVNSSVRHHEPRIFA